MSKALHQRWTSLQNEIRRHKRLLVAFSGGCDSTLLLAATRHVLGKENMLAVTAVSASLPAKEKESTVLLAQRLDVSHLCVETDEMTNPLYVANPTNRCFFCKEELFLKLTALARDHEMIVADGFTFSDRADYRPGYQAAVKWGVVHPLDEAKLEKSDLRVLSRWLALPTWNKPASPCLSSRIPFGIPVSNEILRRVEAAEAVLHAEGFPVVRVRHYGDEARIEVPREQLGTLHQAERWTRVACALEKVGYTRVSADPRGFKSGRLNETAATPIPYAHAYEE